MKEREIFIGFCIRNRVGVLKLLPSVFAVTSSPVIVGDLVSPFLKKLINNTRNICFSVALRKVGRFSKLTTDRAAGWRWGRRTRRRLAFFVSLRRDLFRLVFVLA